MKRIFSRIVFLILVLTVLQAAPAHADGGYMVYFIPVEQVGSARGPQYFAWRFDPSGIVCTWSMMDYGFLNSALLVSPDISITDDTSLRTHADVYAFPDNLDVAITDKAALTAILEPANIPTDWVTASTTYRQLLRFMAGLFQFNQRYSGISGQSLLGGGITLDSNWNTLSAQQKTWFDQTVTSLGYNFTVQGNPKLRSLAKQAGDGWGVSPFIMGGFTF